MKREKAGLMSLQEGRKTPLSAITSTLNIDVTAFDLFCFVVFNSWVSIKSTLDSAVGQTDRRLSRYALCKRCIWVVPGADPSPRCVPFYFPFISSAFTFIFVSDGLCSSEHWRISFAPPPPSAPHIDLMVWSLWPHLNQPHDCFFFLHDNSFWFSFLLF